MKDYYVLFKIGKFGDWPYYELSSTRVLVRYDFNNDNKRSSIILEKDDFEFINNVFNQFIENKIEKKKLIEKVNEIFEKNYPQDQKTKERLEREVRLNSIGHDYKI